MRLHGWVRVLSAAAVAALALGACGDDGTERTITGAPAGEEGAASGLALARCSDLATGAPVEGPLSPDPDLGEAQQWRADNGLRSDAAWVEEVAAMTPGPETEAFGVPLTDDELSELFRRHIDDATSEAIRALGAAHPETYAGMWLDNAAGGVPTVAFTGDVEERRAELAEVAPDVVVVEADWSLAALEEVRGRLGAAGLDGEVVEGTGIGGSPHRLFVMLRVVDAESVERVAEAVGPDAVAAVCVEGRSPEEVPPEGPQPEAGDGWRLLAHGTSGPTYATVVATDEEGHADLWELSGLPGERPAVDLDREIVVLLGPAVSGSCPEIRLDDVVIDPDGAVVHGAFSNPGSAGVCTSDANPHSFVVAVERAALPSGPFRVQVYEEVVCQGCEGMEPAESVELDLSSRS